MEVRTVHDLLDARITYHRAKGHSEQTIISERQALGEFADWCDERGLDLADLDVDLLLEYRAYLLNRPHSYDPEKKLSKNTVHLKVDKKLKAAMRYAHKRGWGPDIEWSLVTGREPRNIERPTLSKAEVQNLVAACDGPTELRDRAIVLVMTDAGLRRAETIALLRGEINLDVEYLDVDGARIPVEGVITVRSGKGEKTRKTMIGARTANALREYWKSIGREAPEIDLADLDPAMIEKVKKYDSKVPADPQEQPAFVSQKGGPLSDIGLTNVFQRLSERSGVYATPHMLRRTAATFWRDAGVPLDVIQKLLGHASIATTVKYFGTTERTLAIQYKSPVDTWNGS